MNIQWFPGHMTKALRMIDENIKLVDGFIYILDARAPFSSLNPEFLARINNKPFVYVLNKSDLADDGVTREWKAFFERHNSAVVTINSTRANSTKEVYQKVLRLLGEKIERFRAKGVKKSVRLMVLGIPNSGKSTLINNFCGKKRAMTGDRPGVTRGKQWLVVDDRIELLDTPGTLYPSFENQTVAKNIAFIGSINDDILDVEGLALDLIAKLQERYPTNLSNRYGVPVEGVAPLEIYESICKARGFMLRQGEVDYSRGATTIIDEFRKGKLGKITLENVKDEYVGI